MIKIEIDNKIKDLAKEHYNSINSMLKKRIPQNELNIYEKKILEYIGDNLEKILIGEPNELKRIINVIEGKIKKTRNQFDKVYSQKIKEEYLKSKSIKELEKIYKNKIGIFKKKDFMISYIIKNCYISNKRIFEFHIYQIIKYIFNDFYENYWPDTEKYNFIKKLNIKVCPYCNRNYITVIEKDKKLDNENMKKRPDIEHFYPKSLYPYLSMSFYNLLPACDTCNKIKSNFDTYKHKAKTPYEIKNDDFIFNYQIKNIKLLNIKRNACKNQNSLNNLTDDSIDIIFDKKIDSNILMLGLDKVYDIHKDEVIKIISKIICYNEVYRKKLSEVFKNLNFTEYDVFEYVFEDYLKKENFQNNSLSKFKNDIFKNITKNILK